MRWLFEDKNQPSQKNSNIPSVKRKKNKRQTHINITNLILMGTKRVRSHPSVSGAHNAAAYLFTIEQTRFWQINKLLLLLY